MEHKVELGWTVKDRITGFNGVVTARCEYISGCNQALVIPPVDDKGAYRDGQWFDQQRLDRVGGDVVILDNGTSPGFDQPAPKR